MPTTEHVKHTKGQELSEGQSPLESEVRKPTPKAAGTRMGIWQDWRGSTTGKGRRRRRQMRDGS